MQNSTNIEHPSYDHDMSNYVYIFTLNISNTGNETNPYWWSTTNVDTDDVCMLQAEADLRQAQAEFDRQAEITKLLLEGITSTHVNTTQSLS